MYGLAIRFTWTLTSNRAMADFRTIDALGDLSGQRVLVRADLNVPMNGGDVTDDTRIRAIKPTVDELLAKGARVVLLSHFGRPKGKVVPDASLERIVNSVAKVLGTAVGFGTDCIGDAAKSAIGANEVVLLENLRFYPGEENNDAAFAAQLAELGDLYINDAFSAAHRAHASTEGIAHLLPNAAGVSMAAELKALEKALGAPEHPVGALVGGAKVSSKLAVLGNLVESMDMLIIGGGMANTFLKAKGVEVGASLCEPGLVGTANNILASAAEAGCEILLPTDAVVAQEFAANVPVREIDIYAVNADDMILDVGAASIAALKDAIRRCKTLVWNGPLGAFEIPPFDRGTTAVAREAGRLTREGSLLSVAGGGDTVAALHTAGVADQFSHVSTAGGAFLEWLEGKVLPGVNALKK